MVDAVVDVEFGDGAAVEQIEGLVKFSKCEYEIWVVLLPELLLDVLLQRRLLLCRR